MAMCPMNNMQSNFPNLTEMAVAIGTDPVAKASLLSLSDEILVVVVTSNYVDLVMGLFSRCTSSPISPTLQATCPLSVDVAPDFKGSATIDVWWRNSTSVVMQESQRQA